MKKLREIVAKQIGIYVNFSEMADSLKKYEARENLDLIRKMRVMYNQLSLSLIHI